MQLWKSRQLTRELAGPFVVVLVVGVAGGLGAGGRQETRLLAATSADASPAAPARACADMTRLSLPETTISSATTVPTAGPVPEYCRVLGTVERAIRFDVSLPVTAWNGKFSFAGGGGYNGSIPTLVHLLGRGYAAAGTDTGHQGNDMMWALDPRARINYGHRATHLVTGIAKEIIRAYYGQEEQRSYWVGCSNGGKMGLMEIQRYPDDYDAALIGNSVIDRSALSMSYVWNAQALAPAPIPPAKTKGIAQATLAACDAQDGLADGLIDQPDKCRFDPKTLTCPTSANGSDGETCLTPAQVTALGARPSNRCDHDLTSCAASRMSVGDAMAALEEGDA